MVKLPKVCAPQTVPKEYFSTSGPAEKRSDLPMRTHASTRDESNTSSMASSIVEACVRIGKPELLSAGLEMLKSSFGAVCGVHTFGSFIKAYCHEQDIDVVWRYWREMSSRHIRPTNITIGCMIEAIVNNSNYDIRQVSPAFMPAALTVGFAINSDSMPSFSNFFKVKLERAFAVYEA